MVRRWVVGKVSARLTWCLDGTLLAQRERERADVGGVHCYSVSVRLVVGGVVPPTPGPSEY